ncbi:MAG: cation diffusion facilitator family transporter [Ignavibacteria bacterium]|nr:cation diffusion facilitator family transporter [Ignavibacteria bacterium]
MDSVEKKEKLRVALTSFIIAVLLAVFKGIVGFATGSLGILSDALHSAMDVFAVGMTFFAVRLAEKPPDRTHNFGHGKVESLSALFQVALLVVVCFWIVLEALGRITQRQTDFEVTFWSFFVVVFVIIVDFNRVRILLKVARKYKSQALEADALHFSSDILTSGVVLVGLIFSYFNMHLADSLAAIIVAIIVFLMSIRLGKNAIDQLLDRAPRLANVVVENIVSSIPEVEEVHNIRVRTSGKTIFIDMNIHLDPNLTLQEAHNVSNEIEKELQRSFKNCQVQIHQEPSNKH